MNDASSKVADLYRYLQELAAVRIRAVYSIKNQEWFKDPAELKDLPGVSVGYRDVYNDYETDNLPLLKVAKPEFEACPAPDETLASWLKADWENFRNSDIFISEKKYADPETGETIVEEFDNDESRVVARDEWLVSRNLWILRQRLIERSRDLFVELFTIHSNLERDPETIELMAGTGFLQDSQAPNTYHPILLKRVRMKFDANENVIEIIDTDDSPQLYSMLLRDLTDVNTDYVQMAESELEEKQYHPFDRNETALFLKKFVHSLTPKGVYSDDPMARFSSSDERLLVCSRPVFFLRKKIDGTIKAIGRIIEDVESGGHIPPFILNIVEGGKTEVPLDSHEETIEEKLAAVGGEDVDILLAKEANREQLEIAKRIAFHNAVLVQGPPGTGKTHTIANLLGHLLSQGKSVLVTSHTSKALMVLKDKLPEGMRGLCVAAIGDNNVDMERSVDAISGYMAAHTSTELRRKAEDSARRRESIINELAKTRKRIYSSRNQELESFVIAGESISPIDAAKFVSEKPDFYNALIPGTIEKGAAMPLSSLELEELYGLNAKLSAEDEDVLNRNIPGPEALLRPSDLVGLLEGKGQDEKTVKRVCDQHGWSIMEPVFAADKISVFTEFGTIAVGLDSDPVEKLLEITKGYNGAEEWKVKAAADGKKGAGFRENWETLFSQIRTTFSISQELVTLSFGRSLDSGGASLANLCEDLQAMRDLLDRKGKLSWLDKRRIKNLSVIESSLKIDGSPIQNVEDCDLFIKRTSLEGARDKCRTYWANLMGSHGAPNFDDLDRENPERIAVNWIPHIETYLGWYSDQRAKLVAAMEAAGIEPINAILRESALDSEEQDVRRTLEAIETFIPDFCELTLALGSKKRALDALETAASPISRGEYADVAIVARLKETLSSENVEAYEKAFLEFQAVFNKQALQSRRNELIQRIDQKAPMWAEAIRAREGTHGDNHAPQNIAEAWKYKQCRLFLDELLSVPLSDLQEESARLSAAYRAETANLAEYRAWRALLERTETNVSLKQSLTGWKHAMKKIGKGTGKRAAALKALARDQMAMAQQAVPAWIMPVSRALDSLDPKNNRFDVVIVDEASQSDVTALAVAYLGNKVIVVGDDKQVSPMSVGVDDTKTKNINDMYLKGKVPNAELYGLTFSLYDVAGTTFQSLMLREHFRCVPQIIGYSNKLSYDFKIKPLREQSSSGLLPAVVSHRAINGRREGRKKANRGEAQEIVSLIISCMKQPEYDGKTFGVISLLGGGDQVKTIQQELISRVEAKDIESRRMLVGEPASFQGDERDVIFLSVVDSNDGEGPLRLMHEGADDAIKKRYNVAASRAKDQLWVVHSLDVANDLKPGDLRKDLIEYAQDPDAFSRKIDAVEAASESPFEAAVAKALVAKGYEIVQQWEVGAYRIDMVVIGGSGRVALECDGERWHSGEEKIREDMERQAILERIGWKFIRIRGSEYYLDPEAAMSKVFERLSDLGIEPAEKGSVSGGYDKNTSDLLERVLAGIERSGDDNEKELVDRDGAILTALASSPTTIYAGKKRDLPEEGASAASRARQNSSSLASGREPIEQKASAITREKQASPSVQLSLFSDPVAEGAASNEENFAKKSVAKKATAWNQARRGYDAIAARLISSGFEVVDMRPSGGRLWVVADESSAFDLRDVSNEFGVRFEFAKSGGKASLNRPAWFMVNEPRRDASFLKEVTKKSSTRIKSNVECASVIREPYQEAELRARDIGNASRYTDLGYRAEIQTRLKKVIAAEAPIEKQKLFNMVRGSLGVKRSGAEIQSHNEWLLSKIPHKTTEFNGKTFIWLESQDPSAYRLVRFNTDKSARKFDEISYEELEAAIILVAPKHMSCSVSELISKMEEALQFKRSTSNLKRVFTAAIDEAVKRGVISEGKVNNISLS